MMRRATSDLRASGIKDRVIKAGNWLPAFALRNVSGRGVRSSDLLANGPLVLMVFRGSW
jgi:peroxiredoxin